MRTLSIDIETYSDLDIKKVGVYRYVDSANFEILLFAYAFDNEEVKVIDLVNDEELPKEVIEALNDNKVIKSAFNANFERTSISKFLNINLKPNEWSCTMIKALTLGLPGSLDSVSKALKFNEDKQKMKEGKALIQYFCKPCKATKVNKGRTRNLPIHDMEKWNKFKEYCKQDVVVEREIRNKLSKYKTTEREIKLWYLDQRINDTGIKVDTELIENAIECDKRYTEKLTKEAIKITGLNNPNSPAQLKKWLSDKVGFEITSLTKESIPEILKQVDDENVVRILELRKLMSKTSIKKYEAMKLAKGNDNRVRGLLQFYGANRTGRWAGRLVQVQNLPQNHIEDLDLARNLLKEGDFDLIELLYDSVPDVLSQLIRTAFIPSEGHRFIVSDFSAIEARVIAWLAGEKWRLDVFNSHGKIYEASASQMFKIPIENIKKGSELRQKGKLAELSNGYGGSVGALISMGAIKMGLKEEELQPIVTAWRNANPNITKFWWDVDKAAKKAIKDRTIVEIQHGIKFIYNPGVLFIELPSSRRLSYLRPKIEPHTTFSGDKITYEGMEQTSKQWKRIDTYGPKLVENIVQATARDCLREAMFNVTDAGYSIVMHVHDELVIDVDKKGGSLEEVNSIMGKEISWAKGLPLKADGYECDYYKKD
ncbi:XRE family transcriptional regulator [Clostridium sp. HMSC19D02]|jgi:DNA polymerase|uniref:DNA-directed DNA polymerase n=3 Tax=Clostridioides difficile TaxID=1496 RepID=A0A9P3WS52_CLODI|nr:DNA polymerase [Clostridioides difficile]OFU05718.1 XRE family transcriptional regulator [Clostridium sp. HMSC19D02]AWH77253.1 DNA polymerase I [Clostridioides difficile]AWH81021.1 DNA polymerase I [Clostridioides difficile]AXU46135.1 dna-directed dna polymerase i [Clostridioides difficile]AXU82744.1 dna-directed dna polymerase i [Clostridioides difficile]